MVNVVQWHSSGGRGGLWRLEGTDWALLQSFLEVRAHLTMAGTREGSLVW